MTETATTYRDTKIYGQFVVMFTNSDGKDIPVFTSADVELLHEWLGEVSGNSFGKDMAGLYRVWFVSSEDFDSRDITEDVAADMAESYAESLSADLAEKDSYAFCPFCQFWADQVIDELLGDAIAGISAARDERAAYYSHADRGC